MICIGSGEALSIIIERFDGGHEWTPDFHHAAGVLLAELAG